jgi:hypothetical protein
MAQGLNPFEPEFTFAKLGIQLVLSETLENNAKMLSMFFFIFRIDKNIVNENHDKLIQLKHEYRVHKIHEMSRGICQPK